MCRPRTFAALAVSALFVAPVLAGEATATNLLVNGGFEATAPLDGKRLAELVADGWRFPGELLAPTGWRIQTPVVSSYFVPGFLAVVRDAADTPEGRCCLRLATPGGTTWLRTLVCQEIAVPASKTLHWSYWVRGHFCLDEQEGQAILRRYIEVKNRNRPTSFLMFQYATPDGQKTLYTPPAAAESKWRRLEGVIELEDCVGKTCMVSVGSYQRGIIHAASNYFDDIRLTPAPAPAKAAVTQAPRAAPVKPLVPLLSRQGHELSPYWKPVAVCGKQFRYIAAEFHCPTPEQLSRFPKLARFFGQCAMVGWSGYPSPKAFSRQAPFLVVGPRWDHGQYCDRAGAQYLNHQQVVSFRPKQTTNGVKGYNLDGWKSAEPLPQWILYDFYKDAHVESVRVYPAIGAGRQTHLKVAAAGQDKRFASVGEYKGPPSKQGHAFKVGRPIAYIKVSVLADSTGQAHILETEFTGAKGQSVKPIILSAASEAAPLNPKGAPTTLEIGRRLTKQYGERFLGFIVYEYCNGFNKNLLEAGRVKRNPLHAARETRVIGFFPFRPMSPRNAEETYRNYCFGVEKIMGAFGGDGPDRVPVTLLDAWHFFEHYTCELGSAMSCTEFATGTWLKVRAKMMFSRSAARQYRKPWFVYHTTGFLAKEPTPHFQEKKAARGSTKARPAPRCRRRPPMCSAQCCVPT